jgi:hypothetical protein
MKKLLLILMVLVFGCTSDAGEVRKLGVEDLTYTDFTSPGGVFTSGIQPVDVRSYGAKGDGVTDDTAAIQAAINAAGSTYPIIIPPGIYKVTATLNLPRSSHLMGLTSGFQYGASSSSTTLRFTSSGVAVNTFVGTATINEPYVILENLTIDGGGTATIGFDGGYFTTLNNVNIINCTVAGLRIGKNGTLGSGQTSYYRGCTFNGNLDGVLWVEGGTQYFSDCIIRSNTRYGLSSTTGITSGYIRTTIIESNTSSGVSLSGQVANLHFTDCYWEQNDLALSANGYQIRTNITGNFLGTTIDRVIFDSCIFGSTDLTKIANVTLGKLQFNNCTQVGDSTTEQITVASGQEVILKNSFVGYPMPASVWIDPGVIVDRRAGLAFGDNTGFVAIDNLSITLGAGTFSVSFVVEANSIAVNSRAILGADVNCLAIGFTGSTLLMTQLNIGKIGSAWLDNAVVTLNPGVPVYIVYTRISSIGKIYLNGFLVKSFADTNNYSAAQSRIGQQDATGSIGMQGRLYAFSLFNTGLTANEVYKLWQNGGSVLAAGLTGTTIDLQFTERTAGSVYDSVSTGQRPVSGTVSWTNPKY